MKRTRPTKWVRGVALELLGVAAIIWIATSAPLASLAPTTGSTADKANKPSTTLLTILPQDLSPPDQPERAEFTRPRLQRAAAGLRRWLSGEKR